MSRPLAVSLLALTVVALYAGALRAAGPTQQSGIENTVKVIPLRFSDAVRSQVEAYEFAAMIEQVEVPQGGGPADNVVRLKLYRANNGDLILDEEKWALSLPEGATLRSAAFLDDSGVTELLIVQEDALGQPEVRELRVDYAGNTLLDTIRSTMPDALLEGVDARPGNPDGTACGASVRLDLQSPGQPFQDDIAITNCVTGGPPSFLPLPTNFASSSLAVGLLGPARGFTQALGLDFDTFLRAASWVRFDLDPTGQPTNPVTLAFPPLPPGWSISSEDGSFVLPMAEGGPWVSALLTENGIGEQEWMLTEVEEDGTPTPSGRSFPTLAGPNGLAPNLPSSVRFESIQGAIVAGFTSPITMSLALIAVDGGTLAPSASWTGSLSVGSVDLGANEDGTLGTSSVGFNFTSGVFDSQVGNTRGPREIVRPVDLVVQPFLGPDPSAQITPSGSGTFEFRPSVDDGVDTVLRLELPDPPKGVTESITYADAWRSQLHPSTHAGGAPIVDQLVPAVLEFNARVNVVAADPAATFDLQATFMMSDTTGPTIYIDETFDAIDLSSLPIGEESSVATARSIMIGGLDTIADRIEVEKGLGVTFSATGDPTIEIDDLRIVLRVPEPGFAPLLLGGSALLAWLGAGRRRGDCRAQVYENSEGDASAG